MPNTYPIFILVTRLAAALSSSSSPMSDYAMTPTMLSTAVDHSAVTVDSEDVTCWAPERSAWSLTCRITKPQGTYAHSVHVRALDSFGLVSNIARCMRGSYLFSSFAQFMGPSGSPCSLPPGVLEETFRVPFAFAAAAGTTFTWPRNAITNMSCGVTIDVDGEKYLHLQYQPMDLTQCVPPIIDMPEHFNFTNGQVAEINCSAFNATPEANVSVTITPTGRDFLAPEVTVTGLSFAQIIITASLGYDNARVTCSVLNHRHYLEPRFGDIAISFGNSQFTWDSSKLSPNMAITSTRLTSRTLFNNATNIGSSRTTIQSYVKDLYLKLAIVAWVTKSWLTRSLMHLLHKTCLQRE